MATYDGPISEDALDYMEDIKKDQASLSYHFSELTNCMTKMADLQSQADTYRDKAAEHKRMMLSAEQRIKDTAVDLRDELVDNLNQAEAEAGPAVDTTGEIGRQV